MNSLSHIIAHSWAHYRSLIGPLYRPFIGSSSPIDGTLQHSATHRIAYRPFVRHIVSPIRIAHSYRPFVGPWAHVRTYEYRTRHSKCTSKRPGYQETGDGEPQTHAQPTNREFDRVAAFSRVSLFQPGT